MGRLLSTPLYSAREYMTRVATELSEKIWVFLCRCGQRWAKLGKTTCLQTIRNGIKRGFPGTDALEPKKQFPEQAFSTKRQTENVNSLTAIQGQQSYIGYAIQKLSDGKSTYALFWLMDYQEDFLLVALV